MIQKVSIRNFKTLADTELELGVVNVLIGANGCGKTNILEAIGMLSAAASGHVDDQAFLRRGVRPGVPSVMKTSLKGLESRDCIQLRAEAIVDGESVAYETHLKTTTDSTSGKWDFEKSTGIAKGLELQLNLKNGATPGFKTPYENGQANYETSRLVTMLLSRLTDYGIFTPSTPFLRGLQPDITQREPVGLNGGRLAEAADWMLFQMMDRAGKGEGTILSLIDWANGFGIKPPSKELLSPSIPTSKEMIFFKDRYRREGEEWLAAPDVSEGALYILFAFVLALNPKSPSLFAIDNFDQALNPRLAKALIKSFCYEMCNTKQSKQAIITIHNPSVLDGLDIGDDRIRLFAVDRLHDGSTHITRIQVDGQLLEENRMTLSQLWVTGRLGGIPPI